MNTRATFFVRDRVGIGFGCYGFMPQGPSVRIVDGRPEASSLQDADVAVVGPGKREGVGAGYGCWGENFDAQAKAYRLVFRHGGRAVGRSRDFSLCMSCRSMRSIARIRSTWWRATAARIGCTSFPALGRISRDGSSGSMTGERRPDSYGFSHGRSSRNRSVTVRARPLECDTTP